MNSAKLGEFQVVGRRRDGWDVIVTAQIHGRTNVFERRLCGECGAERIRHHDAEAWRRERRPK